MLFQPTPCYVSLNWSSIHRYILPYAGSKQKACRSLCNTGLRPTPPFAGSEGKLVHLHVSFIQLTIVEGELQTANAVIEPWIVVLKVV